MPSSEVAAALDSHDLFVMPSRFEGFGIAFVEALIRGLPCIGRRACAMPEIIDEASGGRLVDTEDPHELAELVAPDARRRRPLRRVRRGGAAATRSTTRGSRAATQVAAACDAVRAR